MIIIDFLKVIKHNFFKVNWFKTIRLNFKMLPFKQAVYLPVLVGWRTEFRNITGKIVFDDGLKLRPGVITMNIKEGPVATRHEHFIVSVPGTILVHGLEVHFFVGMTLWINGCLEVGGNNVFGSHSVIACMKNVYCGYFMGCSWNCEIYDTNFHFFRDLVSGRIIKRHGKVHIGDNVFIGNGSIIGKGSYLGDGCVVANFSLVNRSFKREGKNLLIGGNPAQVLMTDFEQIKENRLFTGTVEAKKKKIYDK